VSAVLRGLAAVAGAVALLAAAGSARAAGPPAISAPSAIVVEGSTGDVVFARKPRERRPIASTTKLMTALVTLERVGLDDVFTSPGYSGDPAETKIGLKAGERMSVRDLLTALLLASANDSAVTLAEGVAGTRSAFVQDMNERAQELGLRDTRFANPIGLDDPDNYSTAADLVKLGAALRANRFARRTVDRREATLRTGAKVRRIENGNDLLAESKAVNGIKTGHTSRAGYLLVGSATRRGVTVYTAVMGEPSDAARDSDSLALLDYGLSRFRLARLVRPRGAYAATAVRYRTDDRIPVVAARGLRRVVRRGARVRVTAVGVPGQLEGPLPRGTRAGTLVARVNGRVVGRIPLVTATTVPEVTIWERAGAFLTKPGTLAAAIAILIAALAGGVWWRRRRMRRREPEAEPA
jgi:serine-type D-Ala-D-Ala carboxypeptidase (penicillin-binding protein 5/6)